MNSGPLRLLQTSDWHLGQAYRGFDGELADRLRQARLEAVGAVFAAAERLGADLVLVAGDQFDGPMPELRWVGELMARIAAHPTVAVHMIPGNHDPDGPGSVYDRSDFRVRAPANLHLHRRAEPVRLPEHGATLYPCPCAGRFGTNPMAWIPPRGADDGWRIALAHGSLPGGGEADARNFPIPADAPSRYDLDYVALGDWHAPTPDPGARPGERMYYAGAPEVGGWDETAAGFALEVVLAPGAAPQVMKWPVGRYEWLIERPELHTEADVARCAGRLAALASERRIVRVRPVGALSVPDRQALEDAIEDRRGDFARLELDARDLRTAAEDDGAPPSDPLLRAVVQRLARLAGDPTDAPPAQMPPDLAPLDAEVVRLAQHRLRALLSE